MILKTSNYLCVLDYPGGGQWLMIPHTVKGVLSKDKIKKLHRLYVLVVLIHA